MQAIRINGGRPLEGRVAISGAKNAALPLMAAALLSDQPLELHNVPDLADIKTMATLLSQHGALIQQASGGGLALTASTITSTTAPYDLVRKMRASILVLGPLLARCHKARVSLPGGCAIGTRPVDLHLNGLAQLGAQIELSSGYIEAQAPTGLIGNRIVFPFVSVGATENLLMAATLAKGETVLVNAAREPEINDLVICLRAMGAKIDGLGTDTLTIQGTDHLHKAVHAVVPDRIETGTYAMAAAITKGHLFLEGTRTDLMEAVFDTMRKSGVTVTPTPEGIDIDSRHGVLKGVDAMTEPFPGFPTDLQAQMMALMAVADGAAMITETIFENRFMHVPELCRMGADITVHGASAMVRGTKSLTGAPVMASDLRASASLVLAGLAAQGETVVNRVYHLDRGYDRMEEKLRACGASIERIEG